MPSMPVWPYFTVVGSILLSLLLLSAAVLPEPQHMLTSEFDWLPKRSAGRAPAIALVPLEQPAVSPPVTVNPQIATPSQEAMAARAQILGQARTRTVHKRKRIARRPPRRVDDRHDDFLVSRTAVLGLA